MTFIAEVFFSGCISKVINDVKDYSWTKIKSVINDKNDRNLSTRIYRVIEKALIKITDKKFKSTDILYEAIEKIFIEFRDHGNTIESVKCGLGMLNTDVTVERCENFLEKIYEGICQDEELHRRISLILQEKGIQINQEVYKQLNETVEYGFSQLNRKVDKIDEKIGINNKINNEDIMQHKELVKSRTQEYADKWEANMFLNNFNKRDENAGINVKLRDVYLRSHLPYFFWRKNSKLSTDLNVLLSEYVDKNNDNQMLLIFGQPGIGKSTLITWMLANYKNSINKILVYQFASDLKNIEWGNINANYDFIDEILKKINLSYDNLNGKILIIDGFDEISIGCSRTTILNQLYRRLIKGNLLENFSLIITCRENYVENLDRLDCDYITLLPWNEKQIQSFCKVYGKATRNHISENTMENILKNKSILGIPLILYMVLALNIPIEKEGSIVDVYDQIFSLEGGIYDRCINNIRYENYHWINRIKKEVHQISREISIWMFENNPDEAYIPKDEYEKLCFNIMQKNEQGNESIKQDLLIGNFFRLVRHCEEVESEKLYFIHRSIYEYFVVETIFDSIVNSMTFLTESSQEEFARNIAGYLKQGQITYTIGEYLKHKIIQFYNKLDVERKERFYEWWEMAINKMMIVGMFYYTANNIQNYKDIIAKETRCFINLMEILRQLVDISGRKYIVQDMDRQKLAKYIKYCSIEYEANFNLNKMFLSEINLAGVNLRNIHIENTNLSNAVLIDADLRGAVLVKTDLTRADLNGAFLSRADLKATCLLNVDLCERDLSGVDLRGAKIRGIKLRGAKLNGTIFSENQIAYLRKYYNLNGAMVYVKRIDKILYYEEFQKKVNDKK